MNRITARQNCTSRITCSCNSLRAESTRELGFGEGTARPTSPKNELIDRDRIKRDREQCKLLSVQLVGMTFLREETLQQVIFCTSIVFLGTPFGNRSDHTARHYFALCRHLSCPRGLGSRFKQDSETMFKWSTSRGIYSIPNCKKQTFDPTHRFNEPDNNFTVLAAERNDGKSNRKDQ